jgi:hypothetical protein
LLLPLPLLCRLWFTLLRLLLLLLLLLLLPSQLRGDWWPRFWQHTCPFGWESLPGSVTAGPKPLVVAAATAVALLLLLPLLLLLRSLLLLLLLR